MTVASPPPLSRFRRAGNLIFTSGQLPRGRDGAIVPGDIRVQARQAIANLQTVLGEAGARLDQVVKVTAWLTDASYMAGFNEVYREAFGGEFPARSTVISGLVAGDVEIEAVAFID
ncbi:Enamine deaminase RidA, house cleaning of reactive enamine intermediates, YjgF/YER057c/UK114 family [Sphingomonas laterariae]|uniref:Enamine deaminase RidA, house cleaning of reactive enamine intermediates, YjgF/YER057c/UK114 family n=1 Tax=Edaphosphingomonas laterariae TaxID=861865 RepID=A0A239DMN9_9SPHN|nr:RidA family protein [Sphingomonas laterariae]SNS33647.1 Enamine deaminase RidA, house cleaning of reactive enamine intermediates, YjgF/YER057c/UK114 family [Sphingomonas laterariae]